MSNEHFSEQQESIAVIGLAGRFPGADSIGQFWENLCNGVESIATFSDEELLAAGADPKVFKNPHFVRKAATISDPAGFDASFFGYTPREAELTDPQHRIFLECCWSALENAGCAPRQYDGIIGVFAGASMNHYIRNILFNQRALNTLSDLQYLVGNDKDFLTTRVSYKLNLKGPSFDIQSACSTSLVALHVACQNLLTYQCDIALSGGVSLQIPSRKGFIYAEGDIRSPDGQCRAFDATSNGTVVGEGVAVVVLKRYSDALKDHDTIYARILATNINNDGAHKAGYTAPSIDGQADVIATTHALAGISADSIGYIETHGTGTPLGDPIEIAALTKAFRKAVTTNGICAIGSVKSNIGHLDTAAGITGFIKAVLAVYHKKIPPSLHFTKPNPKLNLESSPFFVCNSLTEWKQGKFPRRAGISSFGVGGTNAHAIIEEVPQPDQKYSESGPFLFNISAKSATALETATKNLSSYLQTTRYAPQDIAFTLQRGRHHFPFRRFTVGESLEQVAKNLSEKNHSTVFDRKVINDQPAVVLMFTGQGSQYCNMARDLYYKNRHFQRNFDICNQLFLQNSGINIKEVLYNSSNQSTLEQTSVTQPALFTIEYSMAKTWEYYGIKPTALIGHSIGEYVAATVSGVFSLEDATTIVATRGHLMQSMKPGAMMAVSLSEKEIEKYLSENITIAAINGPQMCTVSGTYAAIDDLEKKFVAQGIEPRKLVTSHAFHSSMMDPMLDQLMNCISKVTINNPTIPYISNVSGTWISAAQLHSPHYWADHTRGAVRFSQGIECLYRELNPVFLEVGPGTTLKTLATRTVSTLNDSLSSEIFSSIRPQKQEINDQEFLTQAAGHLWSSGVDLLWENLYSSESLRKVPLPTYPFEHKRYWIDAQGTLTSLTVQSEKSEPVVTPEQQEQPQSENNAVNSIMSKVLTVWQELLGVKGAGPDDDFFATGGDSVWASRFIARINSAFSISLPVSTIFKNPTPSKMTAIIEPLAGGSVNTPIDSIPIIDNNSSRVLSPSQLRLWFLYGLNPDSAGFNLATGYQIKGALNLDALKEALKSIISRHEILRTSYPKENGKPIVQVHTDTTFPFEYIDLRKETRQFQLQFDNKELTIKCQQPYDLYNGPLYRLLCISYSDQEHLLVFMTHHIISDGWSFSIVLKEIGQFYKNNAQIESLKIQFTDYAHWLNSRLQKTDFSKHIEYWKKELQGYSGVLEIPCDFPRPPELRYSGFLTKFTLDSDLSGKIRSFSLKNSVTVFSVLFGAFYSLLSRYCSQGDIVIGSPIANRQHPDTENLIGFFLNMLPIRISTNETTRFSDIVSIVKNKTVSAFEHSELPLEQLIDNVKPPRDISRSPLFQVMFAFQNYPIQNVTNSEITISPVLIDRGGSEYDLSLYMWESEGILEGAFEVSDELFTRESVQLFSSYFTTLLTHALDAPDTPMQNLVYLNDHQKNKILRTWNSTDVDFSSKQTLEDLLYDGLQKNPSKVAITCKDQELTYYKLEELSNRMARILQSKGITCGDRIGVCMERTADMVISVIAILKSGAAYVPLDPNYPKDRLTYMAEDGELRFIIISESLLDLFQESNNLIPFTSLSLEDTIHSSSPLDARASPEDLAYVIYTSGSTGKPKGVQIPRRAVLNFLQSMTIKPGISTDDTIMAVTTLSFDISVLEILLPMALGARIVLVSNDESRDGKTLISILDKNPISVLQATPSTWRILLAAGWNGKKTVKALSGGEPFPRDLAKSLIERCSQVWNMYGPTETTVWSTCFQITDATAPIYIGRPIANTTVYVVDKNLNPVAPNVPGELLIGGKGVTLGYRNRMELTQTQFIQNPFINGEIVYKTGDLVRYRNDGNLEYLNRIDSQVKLRGFRIELGEIESVLKQATSIKECVAVCKEISAGDLRLIAYYVSEGVSPTTTELRKHLRQKLPEYMIPQHFFSIDKMPLTPAGKIDRKALPNMFSNVTAKTGSDTPKTDTQIHMAQIWKELLKVEKINLSDNFFDLGGHSLLIMELIAHIKSRFNVELSPRVFLQGTLEQIAASCGTHITPKSTIKHQLDTVAKESPKEGLIKSLFKSARKKF